MKNIYKVAAVVIQEDKFLMVRKVDKQTWTSLGGHVEAGETDEQALLREIKEELGVEAQIIQKLGNFEAPAVFDDATLTLSTYLVSLKGNPKISDPELEEFKYLSKNWQSEGILLPASISEKVLPYCIENGLLTWSIKI